MSQDLHPKASGFLAEGSSFLAYNNYVLRSAIKYGNYHGRLIDKALNDLHINVLLGQITISNTRSKRVNENIATSCTHNQ